MDEIILVGAGGHTRSCIDVIEISGNFKIAGLVEKKDTKLRWMILIACGTLTLYLSLIPHFHNHFFVLIITTQQSTLQD